MKWLLLLLLFLVSLLHAKLVFVDSEYVSISQGDLDFCRSAIGGDFVYQALLVYFKRAGITINHGGLGASYRYDTVNYWNINDIYTAGLYTTCLDPATLYNAYKSECPSCIAISPNPVPNYASCSCNGVCVRAVQSDYRYENYKNPGDLSTQTPTWSTCTCHPDYYGERCQYKKSVTDIKRLAQGLIDIRDFPFLPWYTTPDEKSQWLYLKQTTVSYDQTYTPHSEGVYSQYVTGNNAYIPQTTGSRMWSMAQTQIMRGLDNAHTIWAWPGSSHSCPFGMTIGASYGSNVPAIQELDYSSNPSLTYIQAPPDEVLAIQTSLRQLHSSVPDYSFSDLNEVYLYYYGIARQRQHFTCMCDATRGSDGCSGQGLCRLIRNHQDVDLDFSFSSGTTGSDVGKYASFIHISDTNLHPPIPEFPKTFWRTDQVPYNHSWGNANMRMVPSEWSTCECYPDFDGIYCEIDNRNQNVCGGNGIYKDTLVGPNVNQWDDPGDCMCIGASAPYWSTPTPPPPVNDFPLMGYTRSTFYRRSTDRTKPIRKQFLCIEDKDVTQCKSKGIYNSVYLRYVTSQSQEVFNTIGCECFLFQDATMKIPYTNTFVNSANLGLINPNRAMRENIAGGVYCETTCRKSKCNNHGTCKYQLRSEWRQTQLSLNRQVLLNWDMHLSPRHRVFDSPTGFWPTEDITQDLDNPKHYDLVVSDICECDEGWTGPQCQQNADSKPNCDGFAINNPLIAVDLLSCKDACDPDRSFYNDTLARCIGKCPLMTAFDAQDPITNDKSVIGKECGGASRGTCTGFDGRSKICECKPGFTNPEQGCNLSVCLRVRGQMCNGKGTCELQKLVTSPSIGRDVFRCRCDVGWKGDACDIPDRTGSDDKCNSNTQHVYNRDGIDWSVV